MRQNIITFGSNIIYGIWTYMPSKKEKVTQGYEGRLKATQTKRAKSPNAGRYRTLHKSSSGDTHLTYQ